MSTVPGMFTTETVEIGEPAPIPSPYLIEAEAADYLRVSRKTLARWRLSGDGPAYRQHGRHPRYHRADLDAWSEQQRRTSTSEAGR